MEFILLVELLRIKETEIDAESKSAYNQHEN